MKSTSLKVGVFGAGVLLAVAVLSIYSFGLVSESTVLADEPGVDGGPSIKGTPRPPISMVEKVRQGIDLLKLSAPLKFESNRSGLVRKQIALALFNTAADQIFEKRVWVAEQDIRNYKKLRSINLTPDQPGDSIVISVEWWNSFNSSLGVSDPDIIVLANKYLLPSSSVPNPKERSKGKYTEIIYSPYSDRLATPDLIQAGKRHIASQVDAAYNDLERKRVASKSVPGKLVTEIVNKDFIKNIIVVEHVDPGAFALSADGGKALTERVLTIIGSNQGRAFNYTGSPAGALGIAQFIRPTYKSTRLAYPSAPMLNEFEAGMTDHKNAFMAMVLFFDQHKKSIEGKIVSKTILNQIGGVPEDMLAAAYNGGPSRVIRSVNRYGIDWADGQLDYSLPQIFRNETLAYINKFRRIKNLDIF